MKRSAWSFDETARVLSGPIRALPRPRFEAARFFLAHCGVLVLAYRSYSAGLLSLKADLPGLIDGLVPERPGSVWPKTTLGALSTDEPLSDAEIDTLYSVCDRAQPGPAPSVVLDALHLAELTTRSMERIRRQVRLPFHDDIDNDPVPEWHLDHVRRILEQWESPAGAYADGIRRSGHREAHYRSSHHETSLVGRVVPVSLIPGFRRSVNEALPGRYAWFDDSALHITIRTFGSD